MDFPVLPPKINQISPAMVKICTESGRLLSQQIEALESLRAWFDRTNENDIALVCMPTGSGKTGIIACLPYYLASISNKDGKPRYLFDKPILVVAPDLAIQNQLVEELTSLTRTTPFLKRRNIVPLDRHNILPVSMKVDSTVELKTQQNLKSKELIIANAQKFGGEDWIEELESDLFRLVVVDEAHHHPATTWERIVKKFRNKDCPVVFFTATPYRTDKRPVFKPENGIAYHLTLEEAVEKRMIRRSKFQEINDDRPIYKTADGKMVAILTKVKQLLDLKRQTFGDAPHMAIAICQNTTQADRLFELWQSYYPDDPAERYHSGIESQEKERIMADLRDHKLRLVIIVAMLLEGFDHPPISIAAITYEIKSPVRFVQFVGRAQRIYRQPDYHEPEELCADIVTHKDYNQLPNYEKFTSEALIP